MADASRTVRVRFDGNAAGLITAAKQGEQAINKFGDNAGRQFRRGFARWALGSGGDFNEMGRFISRTFGAGLAGGLSTPVLGPILLGVLTAVAVTVGPVVGALLATGLVGAFGAGLAGLGFVFAAQSERVKSAFRSLKDDLVSGLQDIATPFQDTLVQIAGFLRRTFESFRPTLAAAFAGLAPIITGFADQFFKALEKFRPALSAISDAFGALLTSLGPKLGPLFADIADTIEGIADTIATNSETFASLITFVLDAVDAMVEFIGVLARAYVAIGQATETLNPLGQALRGVGLEGGNAAQQLNLFSVALGPLLSTSQGTASQVAEMGAVVFRTMEKFDAQASSIQSATAQLAAYQDQVRKVTDPVFALTSALDAVDSAQSSYNAAVAEFGAASPQAASAALDLANRISAAEAAASNGDLSFGAFESRLRSWVAAGQLTAAQAAAIRARVSEARAAAEDYEGNYAATLTANTADAATRLAAIRNILDQIRSKTITITARAQIPAGLTARSIEYYEGRRQHGGPVLGGRTYLVGEAGPELLTMPAGTAGHVSSTAQTAAALSGPVDLSERSIRGIGEVMGQIVLAGIGTSNAAVARTATLYGRA